MSEYDADYYLNGPATGKSNYKDYSWKPDLTLPMADWLKRCLHIRDGETLLDVGCARGYLVKALRMRGVLASGYDTSEWAIQNADVEVRPYVSTCLNAQPMGWDYVTAKDVFEHIPLPDLRQLVGKLVAATRRKLLIIVPLSWHKGGPYLRTEDNSDPSHVHAWTLPDWIAFIGEFVPPSVGFVTGSWHYPGLKPASAETPRSCGFVQFTRV